MWRRVVLPQAVRKILPSLGNYVISMFKEIPFLLFISVPGDGPLAKDLGGSQLPLRRAFHHLRNHVPSYQLPRLRGNEEIGDPP